MSEPRRAPEAGSAYTEFDISDQLERQRDVSSLISSDSEPDSTDAEFSETLNKATEIVAEQYDSVEDYVASHTVDWVPEDDTINSSFPGRAMVKAYILKRVSPDISGYDTLEYRLNDDRQLAQEMGFEPGRIPDHTTFSTQWWERYRPDFRRHARYEAAKAAVWCRKFDLEISDDAEELIEEFDRRETPDEDTEIPEEHRLENESRDRVFNEFRDLFNGVIDYGRGPNKQIPSEDLTELATFSSRRNESVLGGRDVFIKENEVTDGGYFTEEALAKPIRNFSRRLAEENYARNNALVPGEECHDWSVNPEDRDFGEGESWHKRTERGIDKQVKMLKERGMLDRPVDICIDGTARDYNNRNDTDVEEPEGVLHRYPKYETGYAWEDITVTAIYRGHAIVLASVSKVKADSQFQCVRYLIDRARDLVNVNNVYADSEYGTQKICSYVTHCGMDYVIKKRKSRGEVTRYVEEEAEGKADYKDYEIEGDDHTKHKTTLVALESTSKNVTKKGEQRKKKEEDEDDTAQTQLAPNVTPEGEGDEDDDDEEEEIKLEAWVTSFDVGAVGLGPHAQGPRRSEMTAFGVGQLYRRRWTIETAFRDVKRNFKAKPRSRCLGIRRFFFMLCILLYNCWVVLNLIVADEMDHRDDEEIIWRKKIFIIDLHNEVFPDLEFG